MINVVFLLLIFFLMSARIAPPEPFEIALPESATSTPEPHRLRLYVDQTGSLSFEGVRGAAVFSLLAALENGAVLSIHADAALPAQELAALLQKLEQAGITQTRLMTGAF